MEERNNYNKITSREEAREAANELAIEINNLIDKYNNMSDNRKFTFTVKGREDIDFRTIEVLAHDDKGR